MPTILERTDSPIVLNAALDRIGRGERIEESVEEAFGEIAPRFHTLEMLAFLERTRGVSDWILQAYTIANSPKLGHYDVSETVNSKKREGIIRFSKPKHQVSFSYMWEEERQAGELRRLRELLPLLAAMGPSEDSFEDAMKTGFLRETFIPSKYTLTRANLLRRKRIEVSPLGIYLFTYTQKAEQIIYPKK